MIDQAQEEFEYTVYYRGTKQQLYTFLYPLTGPANPLFDHLQQKHLYFDPQQKNFEVRYEPKDFENIDKQKEEIVYKSTVIPTQSNYFYSVYMPDYKYFVWQNVKNFVEMRPKTVLPISLKEKQVIIEQGKVELEVVNYEDEKSKARDIVEGAIMMETKGNWEVSKEEYLIHLAK